MDNNKEQALGGNFKLRALKVFCSKENLFHNEKKYRIVYDEQETGYIYCELSFYNKLFDEIDWTVKGKFVCTNIDTKELICTLNKDLVVEKTKNIVYIREGWGTEVPGWWKKGNYQWEVFIENELVGKTPFSILNGGVVTPEYNPYITLKNIKLFESDIKAMPISQRTYLNCFDGSNTRYVNVQIAVEFLQENITRFPLELKFNIFNSLGQLKASIPYFKQIDVVKNIIIIDTGYGAQKPGYWFEDTYTVEITFMDQIIAKLAFEVGKEAKITETPLVFDLQKGDPTVQQDFVPKAAPKLSFEEAKNELEQLIGLQSVKEQINELASYLQFLKVRQEKGLEDNQKINLHSVFVGNPGTGKTTVANLLGKIYNSLGLLSHGKVYEVDRADLVGEFVGQTAPKVKKAIEKARGGILFIDEAYALTNKGDNSKDFGKEVIEILLKELSDGKGDLAIIFAGYPKEMTNFLNSNAGLSSRLRNVIHFPDYSPEDLLAIAEYTAQRRGVLVSEKTLEVIYKRLVEAYRNRDDYFGNARYVNGMIDEAKQNLAIRLIKTYKTLDNLPPEELSEIIPEDVQKTFPSNASKSELIPIDEALLLDAVQQLRALIGLDNIKKEVDEITKLVRYYREIGKDLNKAFSIHTVFTGNPGTGKTTIARLLVQIYKALGILERGHLVEVDRRSLVAGFVGQTAIKTNEMIEKAIGGALFIDEAYALTNGGANDYGREAIETLLKQMEDKRGQFMVIVAGYPKEMKVFIEKNPGLMSRFDKYFDFKDYTSDELTTIATLMFKAEGLDLTTDAEDYLSKHINDLVKHKHQYFGNARTIRKIVQETIRKQNLRMAEIPSSKRTNELIRQISLIDIQGSSVKEAEVEQPKGIGFKK